MQRYKAIIEYCGTNFVGWQRQKSGLSIQQILEETISNFTKQHVTVIAAGRTDAGVHAFGQVIHFDLLDQLMLNNTTDCDNNNLYNDEVFHPKHKAHELHRLIKSLNYFLQPHPIGIISCEEVEKHFHAIISAKARHYKYKIINRAAPPIIDKGKAWWIRSPLNTDNMIKAAQCLVGTNDFTSFRATSCQAPSPIKTLHYLELTQDNEYIEITISASAFLHHMVRNIVGTLVSIGLNKLVASDIDRILAARDRNAAGPTAPAMGLYLMKVDY